MNCRTRGAMKVSLLWVVVLIVLLLGTVGGLYSVSSEKTKAEDATLAAKKLADENDVKAKANNTKLFAVSKEVGFRDEADPKAETRPEQVAKTLEDLRTKYNLGQDATSASRVIEKFAGQVDALNRQLAEAKTQASTAEQARASLEGNLQDMTKKKDEEADGIKKQLSDERDRHANQETTDKARIDDLDKRLKDAETRAKSKEDDLEKQIVKLKEDVKVREGRVAELSKKVEMIRLPDEPDGSVIDASTANTCYIDLGRKQLLRPGTRFKVFNYTKNGAQHDKAMIEVTKVNENMAEATVVDLKDRFDPITKGDKISAPNYDPNMPREFVLVGRFPSGYTRALVADRLRSLGATVKDKVGPATDFLVMGDQEEAAKADEAKEGDAAAAGANVSEDEQLKLAQLYRVQIVQVRDILEYVKYE